MAMFVIMVNVCNSLIIHYLEILKENFSADKDTVERWLINWSQEYPQYARVLSIGTTFEGRNIICVKVRIEILLFDSFLNTSDWNHTPFKFIGIQILLKHIWEYKVFWNEENWSSNWIQIGTNTTRTDKKVVWIDGGIHAREWGAIHTALYFIEQVIAIF